MKNRDTPSTMLPIPPRDLATAATKLGAAATAGKLTPKVLASPLDVDGLPEGELRAAHAVLAGGYAYDRMSVSDAVAPTSQHSAWISMTGPLYVRDFVANLAPRDAIEEAMATQLAVTNGRLMWLTVKLSEAADDAAVARLSEAVDRATNTYRRLALAWHQLRGTAPLPPVAPTIVQNHAAQQVVQVAAPAVTVVSAPKPDPSPPESNPSSNVEKTSDETTLPPEPAGAGSPPPQDRPEPPVGDLHRPADAGGEGPLERQRLQARRAEPRRCPTTPTNRRRAPAGKRGHPRIAARQPGDPGGSATTD